MRKTAIQLILNFKSMRLLFSIITILFMMNSYGQQNEKTRILLDSLNGLDFELSPNIVIKQKLIGTDVAWAGSIDTIEISSEKENTILLFYCSHHFFDTISNELISSKKIKLKKESGGNFIVSIISKEMTMDDAKKVIRSLYDESNPHILVIGNVEEFEDKIGKSYVHVKAFEFYTFRQHYYY